MKYKSILIRMVILYFDYNVSIVLHIFQLFNPRTNSFIKVYIIDLNSILPYLEIFSFKDNFLDLNKVYLYRSGKKLIL